MAVSLLREGARLTLLGQAPSLPGDGAAYIEALGAISAQPEPYRLLVDFQIAIDLTPEQRKAQNLWYKADRALIEAQCEAMAMLRPSADAEMQRVWQSLFSFPVLVTTSRDVAEAFLQASVLPDRRDRSNG